jgi:hypothetical protein
LATCSNPVFTKRWKPIYTLQALLGVPPWIMIKRYLAIAQTDKEL